MAKTNIDWTEHVWNPIAGCTKCSSGCENCYAEKMSARLAEIYRRFPKQRPSLWKYRQVITNKKWNGNIICDKDALEIPLKRKKPTTYFVNSMSDLFHPKVPFEFLGWIFGTMHHCKRHTFQILTKRINIAAEFIEWYRTKWLIGFENAWPKEYQHLHFGVSISTQKEADEKMPVALQIPGFDFISLEPLLEEIDLKLIEGHTIRATSVLTGKPCIRNLDTGYAIKSVIIGCESRGRMAGRFQDGFNKAAISLVEQCKAAGVKVFVKQIPHKGRIIRKEKDWPDCWPKQLRYQEKI
jgi:protein gp37